MRETTTTESSETRSVPMKRTFRRRIDDVVKRGVDILGALLLLVLIAPVIVGIALWIKLNSHGPAFYRARRVGYRGREFRMLKFRKMRDGASGSPLTADNDERFTNVGRLLARSKLDEVPQLWNVLIGQMSLVGPRPEDSQFVALASDEYDEILRVKPGVTGLSQLAFRSETEIPVDGDRVEYYVSQLFPQKARMDMIYAAHRSTFMDLRIMWWTLLSVCFQVDVAVHRETAKLGRRAPRHPQLSTEATIAADG
jgi:lipopolysaccharide/colanic/teichoic acid biosynthesis glycosyltransferase